MLNIQMEENVGSAEKECVLLAIFSSGIAYENSIKIPLAIAGICQGLQFSRISKFRNFS